MGIRRSAAVCATLLLAGGRAAAAPAFDPEIGSHWTVAPGFAARPARATSVPGSACETANHYVTLVDNGRAPEVAKLFAPDAVFMGTGDEPLHGRDAIAAFYAQAPGRVSHASGARTGKE